MKGGWLGFAGLFVFFISLFSPLSLLTLSDLLCHAYCRHPTPHTHTQPFLHTQYSQLLEPLRPTSKPSARRLQELLACHKRFCDQQLANKKTARVLEAAFDAEFTEQYMEQVRCVTLALLCAVFFPGLVALALGVSWVGLVGLADKKTARVTEAAFDAGFTQLYTEHVRFVRGGSIASPRLVGDAIEPPPTMLAALVLPAFCPFCI